MIKLGWRWRRHHDVTPVKGTTPLLGLVAAFIFSTALASSALPTGGRPQFLLGGWVAAGPADNFTLIKADPHRANILYAAGDSGLYKSLDSGATWVRIRRISIADMVCDPITEDSVYIAHQNGVFQSRDAGVTWEARGPVRNVGLITIPANDPNTIYAASGGMSDSPSIYVSKDAGTTWTTRPIPPPESPAFVGFLAVDPKNPDVLFIQIWNWDYDMWGYKSTDGGVSWELFWYNNSMFGTRQMEFDPRNSSIIYAATNYGPYGSTDYGVTWSGNMGSEYGQAVAIDPVDVGTVYKAGGIWNCCATGVARSVDSALSWIAFNDGLIDLRVQDLEFNKTGTYLYAATATGLFSTRLRPDAAPTSFSGRVMTAEGRGAKGAVVRMMDGNGSARWARADATGAYRFEDLRVGETYLLKPTLNRRFNYAERSIEAQGEISGIDFVPRTNQRERNVRPDIVL